MKNINTRHRNRKSKVIFIIKTNYLESCEDTDFNIGTDIDVDINGDTDTSLISMKVLIQMQALMGIHHEMEKLE